MSRLRAARAGIRPAASRATLAFAFTVAAAAGLGSRGALAGALEGPANETLTEIVASLAASSANRQPLVRYGRAALDVIQGRSPGFVAQTQGQTLVVKGRATSFTTPWPPATPRDLATVLTAALRVASGEREPRIDDVRAVARSLAMAADDPFTAYLPPELVAKLKGQPRDLVMATPGIDVWPREPTKVRAVGVRSEAARKGIGAGDQLVAIDGTSTEGTPFIEIVTQLQGKSGSMVTVRVRGAKGERDVTLSRSLVMEKDVVVRALDGGALYVYVPQFRQGVAAIVGRAIDDARPTRVVLDLRHNGGGFVPEGTGLADLFLRDGPIASVRAGEGRPTEDYVAHREATDVTVPLALLVDGGSASASELCTLALKERGRAVVLGTSTAGKATVQRQIDLPDGGVLKVTTAYYVGPSGTRLGPDGVLPERYLPEAKTPTVLEGAEPKDDPWVRAALEALIANAVGARPTLRLGRGPDP